MISVNSNIYNKDYYLNSCLGFKEFKKFKGKRPHVRVLKFLNLINIKKGTRILDLGCGRGDLAIECARRGAKVTGIDYSEDGIDIARNALKKQKKNIQENVHFFRMDAKNLKFTDNSFDLITSFDVFEHLFKEELEAVMNEISRVLKTGGKLLIHTETNKIYLNFTHHVWSYPMNWVLIKLNKIITKKEYPGLPKDSRNELHKTQHVNEPTFFYLKSLFNRHKFNGKIMPLIPLKETLSWKDQVYNILVALFPISQFFPLHLLFAQDFICLIKNNKK